MEVFSFGIIRIAAIIDDVINEEKDCGLHNHDNDKKDNKLGDPNDVDGADNDKENDNVPKKM